MKKILTPLLLSLALSAVAPMDAYAVKVGEDQLLEGVTAPRTQTVTVEKTDFQYSIQRNAVEKIVGGDSIFKQLGIKEDNGSIRLLNNKEIVPVWKNFLTECNLTDASNQEIATAYQENLQSFLVDFNDFVPIAQQSLVASLSTPLADEVIPSMTPITPPQSALVIEEAEIVVVKEIQNITLGALKIPEKDRYKLALGERATLTALQQHYNIEPSTCTNGWVYTFMMNNQGAQHFTSTTLRNDTAWQLLCLIAGYDFYHDTNNCFFRDPSQYIKNIFNKLNQIEDSVRLLGGSKNLMKNNSW